MGNLIKLRKSSKQMVDAIVGSNLTTKEGGNTDGIKDAKFTAIYFSAHWCPPCRGFTPTLSKFYNDVNANGKVLEVVFVSSDQSEQQMADYYKSMADWLAVPFGDAKVQELKSKYSVSGIPRLVVLKQDGSVAADNGRGDVVSGAADPASVLAKWE